MKKIFALAVAGLAAATVSHAALADGGAKFLGNITTSGDIRSDMGTYWNQITAENGCKWGSIHTLSNGNTGTSQFAWDNYDKCEGAYKWAKEKPGERHFKFHALVWGSQYPNFLCKKKNPDITVEKTKQYITEWFDAVAEHFPDLEYIDVVNEAIWAGDNYHSGYGKPAAGANGISTDDTECGGSYIVEALGGDTQKNGKHQYEFITNAFKMARERWPKAVLIYNDYNTLSWQINEGIELVQTILANGAPVDAYGQQSHDCTGMSKSDFESKMTRIHNETGLPLFVTEYDIGEADDTKQKNDYANQIPFMWETEWVGGITIWGYINGATWAKNTGIIEANGTKRPAMTWLEEYFSKNLEKGKNTTGLGGAEAAVVDTIPQTPFNANGTPWAIPGIIQAEDFDVPGSGLAEYKSYSDASTGNAACAEDNKTKEADCTDYREGTSVDVKNGATGKVVGWNEADEWLEYTVNVAETGTYTMFAAVAAAGAGSSFKLSIDGKDITEELAVPAATAGEENYSEFNKISTDVNLTAGKHVLRLTVVGSWFDIDYINFAAGSEAKDNFPNGGDDTPIVQKVKLDRNVIADYDVFDMQGVFVGRLSAYSMDQAISTVKNGNRNLAKGVYTLRNRTTGNMQSVHIAK